LFIKEIFSIFLKENEEDKDEKESSNDKQIIFENFFTAMPNK
jgi:hypothetical protein